jgi:L,D-peptidoglycan transpeptidase YkuD (ErfK/YbiS/YcfS/YnhG family)
VARGTVPSRYSLARMSTGESGARVRGTTRSSSRLRLSAVLLAACIALGIPAAASPAAADVFSSPATGSHSVIGAILGEYRAMGGPAGIHGFPLTDERATPNGVGRYNHFQVGSIYWTAATGAHSVFGAIRDRWASMGWEKSRLGFPTTGDLGTPDGRGRYNHFQGGSIYWTAATGAHAVYGGIRTRWSQMGWETSALGYPTSEEMPFQGNGRIQHFQYGSIAWAPGTGAYIHGAVRVGGWPMPLGVTPPGTQAITVVAAPGATTGTLTAWERGGDGFWREVLGPIPARLGSAGIGIASEGSARTPAGTYRMTEAFGRQANPGTALPYRRVDGNDWWVSDVRSSRYNEHARCAPGTCPFNERVSENLYGVGAVYDHAVVFDYNRPGAVPGAGSAFFLHIANQWATGGCVAIDRGSLQAIMRWLRPDAQPVISIGIG